MSLSGTTLLAFILCFALQNLAGLKADDAKPHQSAAKLRIIVSGFEPFGGRSKNASFEFAQAIRRVAPDEIELVEVPVVWGAPKASVDKLTQGKPTDIWLAFGEGKNDALWIETEAHNKRGNSADNNNKRPTEPLIALAGEPLLKASDSSNALAGKLRDKGIPTRISKNAGAYLCEEMLYTLLSANRGRSPVIHHAFFIHVPVLGGSFGLAARKVRPFDQQAMDQIAREVLIEVKAVCEDSTHPQSPENPQAEPVKLPKD